MYIIYIYIWHDYICGVVYIVYIIAFVGRHLARCQTRAAILEGILVRH